jgi:TrpR-related protein YerC/YecD
MTKARQQDASLWTKDATDLMRTLLSLQTVQETKRFLRDLMTEDEIRMMVDRWRVARMLASGQSYRQIEDETGLSSRTIARISKWLRQGAGGYQLLLTRQGGGKARKAKKAKRAKKARR